jgi:DNA-binding transcriptional LysR family regulator
MHTEDFDYNLLAVFDAMLRERNVTRAAERLGLSQSAMSHALSRLRIFFEDPLFVKTPEGMTPTAKAETLKNPVLDVVATIRQGVLAQAGFDARRSRRTFTLCMSDMGELVFLPPLLRRFQARAPHCVIRSTQAPPAQVSATLASGEADLALGSIAAAPDTLFRQRLFMHQLATIVSVKNTDVGDELTREQFESFPHVVVTLSGSVSAAYDSEYEAFGLHRHARVFTPHFLTVPLLMDQQHDLIATVPLELANVFARYGVIRVVRSPIELPPFALSQYWHPRFHHDPAIVWLRGMVREVFEHYPDLPPE